MPRAVVVGVSAGVEVLVVVVEMLVVVDGLVVVEMLVGVEVELVVEEHPADTAAATMTVTTAQFLSTSRVSFGSRPPGHDGVARCRTGHPVWVDVISPGRKPRTRLRCCGSTRG